MKEINSETILKILREKSSEEVFVEFQKKLIKTEKAIIGVKVPEIKKVAKNMRLSNSEVHFNDETDKFFESVLLEGLLIGYEKEKNALKEKLNMFYHKMDNWAVVDTVCSSLLAFKKNVDDDDLKYFKSLLRSENVFTVRFAVVCLMKFFIKRISFDELIRLIKNVDCSKYYISMAVSWFLSECFIKEPQNAIKNMQKIIKNNHFNKFVVNKAIQKTCESFRVDTKLKENLKKLRIK